MKGVVKFEMTTSPEFVELHQKSRVVDVTYNGSMPILWIEAKDSRENKEVREFRILKEGDVIKEAAKYVGSCGNNENRMHVYTI